MNSLLFIHQAKTTCTHVDSYARLGPTARVFVLAAFLVQLAVNFHPGRHALRDQDLHIDLSNLDRECCILLQLALKIKREQASGAAARMTYKM